MGTDDDFVAKEDNGDPGTLGEMSVHVNGKKHHTIIFKQPLKYILFRHWPFWTGTLEVLQIAA